MYYLLEDKLMKKYGYQDISQTDGDNWRWIFDMKETTDDFINALNETIPKNLHEQFKIDLAKTHKKQAKIDKAFKHYNKLFKEDMDFMEFNELLIEQSKIYLTKF